MSSQLPLLAWRADFLVMPPIPRNYGISAPTAKMPGLRFPKPGLTWNHGTMMIARDPGEYVVFEVSRSFCCIIAEDYGNSWSKRLHKPWHRKSTAE